jgi:hypothetical protein
MGVGSAWAVVLDIQMLGAAGCILGRRPLRNLDDRKGVGSGWAEVLDIQILRAAG